MFDFDQYFDFVLATDCGDDLHAYLPMGFVETIPFDIKYAQKLAFELHGSLHRDHLARVASMHRPKRDQFGNRLHYPAIDPTGVYGLWMLLG